MSRVGCHGVENGGSLMAGCFESGSHNVPLIGVLSDSEKGALCVVNPVGGEEATESCYKCNTTVVRDRSRNSIHLCGRVDNAQVVLKECDTGASNSDTALKSVDGLATLSKVVCNGRKETSLGDDWLIANVVKEEAAGASAFIIGLSDGVHILEDPEKLDTGGGLASGTVPEDGGFTLVGESNGANVVSRVTLGDELFCGLLDTCLYRLKELHRVMLVPSGVRVMVLEFHLMASNRLAMAIEDKESS
ncbi:hypothetical protein HG530_002478 [Fusarium avenaceum]|nr:hypothetical protein HG530_002478 [Fusarium avenaceum]